MAPPIVVAYFSSFLNPVVVFLVFNNRILLWVIFDENCRVVVDILDICCKKLRIVLSVPKIVFALPDNLKILEFFFISSPSLKKDLILILGNFFLKKFLLSYSEHLFLKKIPFTFIFYLD